jgi:hypothetical protein
MATTGTRRRQPAVIAKEDLQQHRTRTMQTLRRDARVHRDRVRQEALNSLERSKQVRVADDYSPVSLAHSILGSVHKIVTPTLASLGLETSLNLTVVGGWAQHWLKVDTNYRTINLEMALYRMPAGIPDSKWIAHIITTVKGLIYHEAGHILYSVPFADLLTKAREQGANVPFVSEPKPGEEDFRFLYGWAYAILDDQRMECALVRTAPAFGDYLTTSLVSMVVDVAAGTNALGDIWPMVCGRTYMPDDLLLDLRSRAFTLAREHDLIDELNVIEREVVAFKSATTEREIYESLDRILPAMRAWFTGRRTYTALQYSSHRPQAPRIGSLPPESPDPAKSASLDEPKTDNHQESTVTGSSDENDTRDQVAVAQGSPAASAPSKKNDVQKGSGAQAGAGTGANRSAGHGDSDPYRSYIDEDLIGRLTPVGEVTETMKAYHDKRVRQLFREFQVKPMRTEQVSRAHTVRGGMLDLLVPLTSQANPAWRSHQENGILDPVVYRMREPGDTNYWTALDDTRNRSPDLAVSLVLDTSGSMVAEIDDLFVAAIGVRMACEELTLPCTVTTFSDDSRVLFEADEITQHVVGLSHGGTNPLGALHDLANQRLGKRQQLVIVFTDGQWGDVIHLNEFRTQNTVIIGVTLDKRTAKALESHGFDEIVVLDSVAGFAEAVSHALVPYYA